MSSNTKKAKELLKQALKEFNEEQIIDFEQEDDFDDLTESEEVRFAKRLSNHRKINPDDI